MQHITKIKIKNLFGIKEYEADGATVELAGTNGTGKTSVLDAIRYALTNKSDREYIIRNGESEGEILIETDNGLRINRKARSNQADYKSVKRDGREVGSPEAFLRDIFTPLQLDPVEFIKLDRKKQNAMILDLIEYDWNLDKIKEWFGEIPDWISYDQNILAVLNDIQSEDGDYYQNRQEINREARNKRAFIEEIGAILPPSYNADKWEKENLGLLYKEIETIRKENETIEKAKQMIENRNSKARKFEADREIAKASLNKEMDYTKNRMNQEYQSLRDRIRVLERDMDSLSEKKADKLAVIEEKYKADVAQYDAVVEEYKEYKDREVKDLSWLIEQASTVEKMKSYINEYRRMIGFENEVQKLTEEAETLTRKIELARELPGKILEEAIIPVTGLSVKNGIPLINDLPISNLSDGEKLELCVDVAIQKPNGLQIVLLDGVEKLSTALKDRLYRKCKEKGLQFIATRTTDDEELTVLEL